MKKLVAFIFASFLAQSAHAASASIVPTELNVCQRDMNAWGHSTSCECPEASQYEDRIGQCIQGSTVAFSAVGMIATEFAIAGNATNMVMQSDAEQSYDLVLTREMKAQVQELEMQGIQYQVSGDALEASTSNPWGRTVVIVNAIQVVGGSEINTAP